MYHLICLSRGIVPERIILRRTVSHCQKETEEVEESGIELETDESEGKVEKLTPTVAESSVLSLVQVNFSMKCNFTVFLDSLRADQATEQRS